MSTLKGKNILLRALEPSDVEMLYHWENNTEIWQLGNTLVPFSKYILEQYIANSHLDIYSARQLRLVIDAHAGKAIGCIDLFDFDPHHSRAGIGVLIAEKEERKKGFASEALNLLMEYCFTILCLSQLYCNINADNIPSICLFQKHGFIVTGTKKYWNRNGDGWIDELLLQRFNNYKKDIF